MTFQGVIDSSKRIPELDGLRGLAILLVLWLHYAVANVKADFGSPLAYFFACFRLSWSGVDLFFVLSGFLIGGILLDHRESPNYFKTFYVRRACRIFPFYYFNVFLFTVLSAWGGATVSAWLFDSPLPLASYLTFTQNYFLALEGRPAAFWLGPTWSLAVEEQFYLILPFIIRLIPHRLLPRVLTMSILAAPLLRIVLFYAYPMGYFSSMFVMPARADALMLGVLIAYILRKPEILPALYAKRTFLHLVFAVLAVGMAILTVKFPGPESRVMTFAGYTWIALFYGCLLTLGIINREGMFAKILRNRLLGGVGSISYGVYLIHVPILGLCHALLFDSAPKISNMAEAMATLFALAVTLIIAHGSWFLFEKPILKFGQSFNYRDEKQTLLTNKSIAITS